MWKSLYGTPREEMVPIGHITNGVHVGTWLASQMRLVYDRNLGAGWSAFTDAHWDAIDRIDEGELWETHQTLKTQLIHEVRRRLVHSLIRRGEPLAAQAQGRRVLSPDALTIGFARRFATYKRANLLLRDLDALDGLLNDPQRPVQLVFAGKAHPLDGPGKRVLQEVAALTRDARFAGKIVFIEDYDIDVGRHMVQGVDVWLNNPRRPLEACGTSGQKVVFNGGLNLSVLDGWWAEAYDGLNGFAIGRGETHSSVGLHDARDADGLLVALRDQVVPLYYDRDGDGLPREWLKRVKRAIRTLGWRFSADRMVMDYVLKSYIPAAGGTSSS
jgi:starch phosphorylase